MVNNFCVVFLVVAVLATVGSGEYERRYGRPWNDQRLSNVIIVDEAQNKTDSKQDSSSSSSSSEESSLEMAGKTTTAIPDCKNQTEVPTRRSGDSTRRRSSRLQRKSLQSQYTADGATIPRRHNPIAIRTEDRDSLRTQTDSSEETTTSNYKLHLLSGRYVQYGDENRWTIWPRLREDGESATHGVREKETDSNNYRDSETTTAATNTRKRWPKTSTTSRWVRPDAPARPELRSGGRARPELRSGGQAPRLELKSGDNVQFGDGISWQILVSGEGLTRIGTIDGRVMVRIFRPYTEEQRRRYYATGHHEVENETTTEASPEKCQMGQDCYNKMLNYQNYGFHLNH